jgi:outer membrane lipase/esterase
MRIFQRSLLAGTIALGLAASGTASAQFSNAYFFGDSVSDSGNFKSQLPPGTGKFTTNPGPVWSEVFAERFGLTANPSNSGGTNYAYGGARIANLPGDVGLPLSGMDALPVTTQVQQYLAKGSVDPNALYSIQGGGNDFTYQFGLLLAGAATPAQVQAALAAAAVDLGKQAAILKAAGARYILVMDAPDMGTILTGAATGQGATLTALSNAFNMTLDTTLDTLGIQAIRIKSAALQNEILKNPAAFGIKNVTGIACTTSSTVTIALCNSSTLVSPDAASTYFFANGSHPTSAVHKIFGDYAISVVVAPQQMSALAEAPLAVEQASWRAVDGRMVSGINAPRSQGKIDAWASYDYGNPDVDSGYLSGNGDVNTISVGGDVKMSDRLLVGAMFNYSENKTDFGGLDFKLKEPMGTVYVGYGEGPWYVGGTLGAGGLDYSTTRSIALGVATRDETGNTSGWQYVGRLMGGYWFQYADWVHGPTAKLTYQEIRVRQFQENGSNSTTMTFGQQERKSFQTSLGWQVSGNVSGIRPFARASWEYEGQSDDRTVSASVYGTTGTFDMPAFKPDNNWGLFNLGAATEFGKVTGYVTGSATAGKSDGDYWAITVGLRAPL